MAGPGDGEFNAKTDVLFAGLGATAVAYYRCFLPARAIGTDWVGIAGEPPNATWITGLVNVNGKGHGESRMPDMLNDYKVVVLQQPAGKGWNDAIKKMRERGIKVLYEIDDYLHGIQHMEDHDFKAAFDKEHLRNVEQAMKRCDGIICSTPFIAEMYRHFNKNVYVCRNGIDPKRYELTRPDRPTTNIGWAGGTGHAKAILPWLQQTANVMARREDTTFVSIGQPFAAAFRQHFGEQRCIAVPFAALEQYPAAMTMLDIGLAPSGKGAWWKGKSDLRWLEAGALGIPLIASPTIYPSIEDGVTGFTATNAAEMAEKLFTLVDDDSLRIKMGEAAKEEVLETRTVFDTCEDWQSVFSDVLGLPSD